MLSLSPLPKALGLSAMAFFFLRFVQRPSQSSNPTIPGNNSPKGAEELTRQGHLVHSSTEAPYLRPETTFNQFHGGLGRPLEEMAPIRGDNVSQSASPILVLIPLGRIRPPRRRRRDAIYLQPSSPYFLICVTEFEVTRAGTRGELENCCFSTLRNSFHQIIDSTFVAALKGIHTSSQLRRTGADVRPRRSGQRDQFHNLH